MEATFASRVSERLVDHGVLQGVQACGAHRETCSYAQTRGFAAVMDVVECRTFHLYQCIAGEKLCMAGRSHHMVDEVKVCQDVSCHERVRHQVAASCHFSALRRVSVAAFLGRLQHLIIVHYQELRSIPSHRGLHASPSDISRSHSPFDGLRNQATTAGLLWVRLMKPLIDDIVQVRGRVSERRKFASSRSGTPCLGGRCVPGLSIAVIGQSQDLTGCADI